MNPILASLCLSYNIFITSSIFPPIKSPFISSY
nr:MAG TPA: hypothetical protein [Caudoviricetes sp.]